MEVCRVCVQDDAPSGSEPRGEGRAEAQLWGRTGVSVPCLEETREQNLLVTPCLGLGSEAEGGKQGVPRGDGEERKARAGT